jgi:hypothetical protein
MTLGSECVIATAQFFDDARYEVGSKTTLVGHYSGDMFLPPMIPPVDRLSLWLTIKYPREYKAKECSVRIEIPGQPPLMQALPLPVDPDFTNKPPSPFSGVSLNMVVQMRFLPLRVGDVIDAWVIMDGREIPAGRLYILAPPPSPALN